MDWQRRTRLLAVALALLASACVTPTMDMGPACEGGKAEACSTWGHQLLAHGEKQEAENAFARSCEGGNLDDCTTQGTLMMERGELHGAEAPLRKAYDSESEEAALALADLYQARGEPGDSERMQRMRWDALAIGKPPREVTVWYRLSPSGERGYALAYSFQDMAFWSRRMSLGLHFAGNDRGANELNASVAYQHFLTPEVVPYAMLLLGGAFQQRTFNAGMELGVKWCLGPIGHLNIAGGTSVGSPPHLSVGVGINSLPVDILLLLAAYAH
jgi:hypothetical protein